MSGEAEAAGGGSGGSNDRNRVPGNAPIRKRYIVTASLTASERVNRPVAHYLKAPALQRPRVARFQSLDLRGYDCESGRAPERRFLNSLDAQYG